MLSVCVSPIYFLNAWTTLYESWYILYHGTWAHLNGVLHKTLPSVCVPVCVPLLSLLGNSSVKTLPRQRIHTQQWKNCWMRRFLCLPCSNKESRQLVLPRTSCNLFLKENLKMGNAVSSLIRSRLRDVTAYVTGSEITEQRSNCHGLHIRRRNCQNIETGLEEKDRPTGGII
jgi:hypothetical protein